MALTEGTPQNFAANPTEPVAVKINTNIGVVVYDDIDNTRLRGRVLDISSGSLSLGATNDLNGTDRGIPDICSPENDKLVMAFRDSADADPKLKVVSRSGTTLTPGTEYTVETVTNSQNPRVATPNSTVGLMAYRKDTSTHRLVRFTISGTTLIVGSPQTHGSATDAFPLSIEPIDTNRVLYLYYNQADALGYVQVINLSSGISEGTPQVLTSVKPVQTKNRAKKMIAKLSSTKFLVIYFNEVAGDTDRIEARTVNISGDSISSVGSALTVHTGDGDFDPSTWVISASKVIIAYRNASNQSRVGTLNISGDTVTDGGDTITLTNGSGSYYNIPILADEKAVVAYSSDIANGYASLISGVPPPAVSSFAKFYHGLGSLSEKFTLPFAGVQPGAMTLDKSLGTVVMGQNAASTVPIVYSLYPYVTGVATATGMPTGTSISSLKWV